MAKVQFTQHGDLGEIVIADPPLNLVSLDLARDLTGAVEEARRSAARAILVRAEGDNFSAGANVEIFLDRDEGAAHALIDEFMPVIRGFAAIPVPTVAAVQGLCLAAGLEVALSCDLIWAAEGTQLGLPEGVIGATPFGGGTQRLVARAGAGRAAEAVLGARIYPAETMLEWGVVNRIVAADELPDKARSFARQLAAGPTLAHAATKRMIELTVEAGVEAADAALPEVGAQVIASDDLQNGARTLLEKGPGHATFTGSLPAAE
jgi:enoyl-CoA hydratase/carnithine racemase